MARWLKVGIVTLTIVTSIVWFAVGLWWLAIPGTIIASILVSLALRHQRRPLAILNAILIMIYGLMAVLGTLITSFAGAVPPVLWVTQLLWTGLAGFTAIWMYVTGTEFTREDARQESQKRAAITKAADERIAQRRADKSRRIGWHQVSKNDPTWWRRWDGSKWVDEIPSQPWRKESRRVSTGSGEWMEVKGFPPGEYEYPEGYGQYGFEVREWDRKYWSKEGGWVF